MVGVIWKRVHAPAETPHRHPGAPTPGPPRVQWPAAGPRRLGALSSAPTVKAVAVLVRKARTAWGWAGRQAPRRSLTISFAFLSRRDGPRAGPQSVAAARHVDARGANGRSTPTPGQVIPSIAAIVFAWCKPVGVDVQRASSPDGAGPIPCRGRCDWTPRTKAQHSPAPRGAPTGTVPGLPQRPPRERRLRHGGLHPDPDRPP